MKLTWQTHLEIIASRYGIEVAPKKAFMKTFLPCDPNCHTERLSPEILPENDNDYEAYRKAIGKAYKQLGFSEKEPGKAANKVLPFLLKEYQTPSYHWQQEDLETNAKQLDTFLRELNYLEQRQKVQRAIEGTEIRKVFLVQATGTFSQRWLVKRLSLEVSNHTIAKGISISARHKWNRDLNHFWKELSQYTDQAERNQEIIQSLCDRCQTQPLIMAIHGIQEIETQTLQTLLSEFWEELLQKLSEQSWCSDHCDCILFLTTNSGTQHNIIADYGVHLEPWESVTVGHMQQWLKPIEVRQFLAKCSGESIEEACLGLVPREEQLTDHLDYLEAILAKICTTFELNSLAELEPYWKIAS
jgi:hypothetical protein